MRISVPTEVKNNEFRVAITAVEVGSFIIDDEYTEAGVAGTNAARMVLGLGANVEVIDINIPRLSQIDEAFNSAIANQGWHQALSKDSGLARGLNIHNGHVTNDKVA